MVWSFVRTSDRNRFCDRMVSTTSSTGISQLLRARSSEMRCCTSALLRFSGVSTRGTPAPELSACASACASAPRTGVCCDCCD